MTSNNEMSIEIKILTKLLGECMPKEANKALLFAYCDGIATTYQIYHCEEGKNVQHNPDEFPEMTMQYIQQIYKNRDKQWVAFILSLDKDANYMIEYYNDLNPLIDCSNALEWLAYVTYHIEPNSEYGRKTLQETIKAESFKKTLLYACYQNNLDLVKERLIGIKASTLNKKIPYYGTALHIACNHHNLDMVQLLVEAGADISKKHDRQTPLELAYHLAYNDIISYLSDLDQKANMELMMKQGLFLVTNSNNVTLIESIRNKGVDINKVQNKIYKLTPLHLMAYNEKTVGIKTLVKQGADMELKEQYKRTPLHYACHFQKLQGVKALLDCGADVNATSESGETPLHTACRQGNFEMAKLLLEYHANINAVAKMITYPSREYLTETPIETAKRYGYTNIVKLLADSKK